MARLGIAKAGVALTAIYFCFILYSVTRPSAHLPSVKTKRTKASPRKVLERRTLYHQKVGHMEYKDHLPELLAEPGPHYVLFVSGSMDGTVDGQPWCGDCYAASPIVRDLIARAGGALLEVSVGTAEEWHKDTHPVRIDVEAPINYIPTLYHWTRQGPGASLSSVLTADDEADRLKEIVSSFLKETGGPRRKAIARTQEILERTSKRY